MSVTTIVNPLQDGRLAQLAAQYDEAYAAKSAAEKRLKAITDGIKAELTLTAPGADDIRLDSPDLAQPLRLSLSYRTSVDTPKLKAEMPDIYAAFSKSAAVWTLTTVKS